MNWKRIAAVLYLVTIGSLLSFLLFRSLQPGIAVAGVIRRAELSSERPLIVRLAPGRTTVISFSVRPEQVVPGNPQALEIHFLKQDLTIRPLGPHPGNLIVYTKSGRYVILLQLVGETQYDDVVNVSGYSSHSRRLRLGEDTFRVKAGRK